MAGWKRINAAEWESVNVAERLQPEELLPLPVLVDGKPVSRWRKGWLKHIPFLVGDAPKFRLVIVASGDVDPRRKIWWNVTNGLSSGGYIQNVIAFPAMTKGDVVTEDIDLPMLESSGPHTLELISKPGSGSDSLYTFGTVTKERFFLTTFTVLISLIGLTIAIIALLPTLMSLGWL